MVYQNTSITTTSPSTYAFVWSCLRSTPAYGTVAITKNTKQTKLKAPAFTFAVPTASVPLYNATTTILYAANGRISSRLFCASALEPVTGTMPPLPDPFDLTAADTFVTPNEEEIATGDWIYNGLESFAITTDIRPQKQPSARSLSLSAAPSPTAVPSPDSTQLSYTYFSATRPPPEARIQPTPLTSFYGEWCSIGTRILEPPLRVNGNITFTPVFASLPRATTLDHGSASAFLSLRNFTVLSDMSGGVVTIDKDGSRIELPSIGFGNLTYYFRISNYQLLEASSLLSEYITEDDVLRLTRRMSKALKEVRVRVIIVASYLFPAGDPLTFSTKYRTTRTPSESPYTLEGALAATEFISEEIINPSTLPERSSGLARQLNGSTGSTFAAVSGPIYSSERQPSIRLNYGDQNYYYSGPYASHFIDSDDVDTTTGAIRTRSIFEEYIPSLSPTSSGLVIALKFPQRLLSDSDGGGLEEAPAKPLWVFTRVEPAVLKESETANDLQTAKNSLADNSLLTASAFFASEWSAVTLLPKSVLPPVIRDLVSKYDPDLGTTSAASDVLSSARLGPFWIPSTGKFTSAFVSSMSGYKSPIATARRPGSATELATALRRLLMGDDGLSVSKPSVASKAISIVLFILCPPMIVLNFYVFGFMVCHKGGLPRFGYMFCESYLNPPPKASKQKLETPQRSRRVHEPFYNNNGAQGTHFQRSGSNHQQEQQHSPPPHPGGRGQGESFRKNYINDPQQNPIMNTTRSSHTVNFGGTPSKPFVSNTPPSPANGIPLVSAMGSYQAHKSRNQPAESSNEPINADESVRPHFQTNNNDDYSQQQSPPEASAFRAGPQRQVDAFDLGDDEDECVIVGPAKKRASSSTKSGEKHRKKTTRTALNEANGDPNGTVNVGTKARRRNSDAATAGTPPPTSKNTKARRSSARE